MSDIAIRAHKLGKRYERYEPRSKLLQWIGLTRKRIGGCGSGVLGARAPLAAEFWALKDVSFEIKRGELVGVIGQNGAGKSTLLNLLSRITEPTTGRADIFGRVGSLLGIGTGFHPDLTGRENVFLNGAFLGMTRADVRRRFDEIVAFAEIEDFLDAPVKHYSSGMYTRLAFSVAAHLEPDILIVDEVLAVGDASFQKKSFQKMHSLVSGEGRTLLLVSHNAIALSQLCDKGLYLANGAVKGYGAIDETLRLYLGNWDASGAERHTWDGNAGDEDLALLRTWVEPLGDSDGFQTGAELEIGAEIDVRKSVHELFFAMRLFSEYGYELVFSLSDDGEPAPAPLIPPGRMIRRWRIPKHTLAEGRYRVAFALGVAFVKRVDLATAGTLWFTLSRSPEFAQRCPGPYRQGFTSLLRPQWVVPE
jgi:lipopolysaccharide transport system ATP-binding protein